MSQKLILITAPTFLPQEADVLTALLTSGLERLHLRKPGCPEQDLAALIEQMPANYRSRITLHDHFNLQSYYQLGGIHLNRRNPTVPDAYSGMISRSCHSIEEVAACREQVDYLFLSPLFDSISKQGYNAAFSPEQLHAAAHDGVIDAKVIALGGVSLDRLPTLRTAGFGGAAILGDIWERYHSPDDLPTVLRHFELLKQAAR